MTAAFFVALMLTASAILFRTARGPDYRYYIRSAVMWSGLTVGSWYVQDVPTANRTALIAVLGAVTARAAWRARQVRPRPGWWNGEHERIEQT